MKTNLYIPIEISKRELDSRILLSLKSIKYNFEPVITKKSRLFEKLSIIKPGIFFFKSFGPNYDIYLDKIKSNNHLITGIDEEGLQVLDKSWIIGKRFSKKILNHLEIIFTWGNSNKKIYQKFFKIKKKNIQVISSGHPKMELSKKYFYKYYFKTSKKIKNKFKNFILIATLFPRYNRAGVHQKNQEFVFNDQKKNIKTIYEKMVVKRNTHQRNNFFEYDKLYQYLSKNFKDINFLIKPHPAENLDYYDNLAKKNYRNIKILKTNENIVPYILSAQTCISCNCTTSIETFLLGKNCINFIPWQNKKSEFPLPRLLSINVRKIDKLGKILRDKQYLKKNKISKKNINLAKNILQNFTGDDACEKILKHLNLMKKKITIGDTKNNNYNYFNYLYFYLKSKIIILFTNVFKSESVSYQVQKHKRLNLNKNEIQKRVDQISKNLFLNKKKFQVEEKHYGLFYINEKK